MATREQYEAVVIPRWMEETLRQLEHAEGIAAAMNRWNAKHYSKEMIVTHIAHQTDDRQAPPSPPCSSGPS